MIEIVNHLFIDHSVRNLCSKPYPLHPKGCPNYNKRPTCPPQAALIENIIDLSRRVYVIWTVFDFGLHKQQMKYLHPDWSKRQCECCLYWQSKARKELRNEIEKRIVSDKNNMIVLACPEAHGVNVTATMASIGEILEWPPITKTYQIAVVGWKKEKK
jgi:predicted metal-binding protein